MFYANLFIYTCNWVLLELSQITDLSVFCGMGPGAKVIKEILTQTLELWNLLRDNINSTLILPRFIQVIQFMLQVETGSSFITSRPDSRYSPMDQELHCFHIYQWQKVSFLMTLLVQIYVCLSFRNPVIIMSRVGYTDGVEGLDKLIHNCGRS